MSGNKFTHFLGAFFYIFLLFHNDVVNFLDRTWYPKTYMQNIIIYKDFDFLLLCLITINVCRVVKFVNNLAGLFDHHNFFDN